MSAYRLTASSLILLLALAAGPSLSQPPKPGQSTRAAAPPNGKGAAPEAGTTSPAPPPPPEPPPPPYEPKLLRLGEILGTLAYLRGLCGAGDGEEWRSRMSGLIAAEGDTPVRRERLAGAFNRGFRGYQVTYRTCTPSARVIIERALEEGERITRDVATRYAG